MVRARSAPRRSPRPGRSICRRRSRRCVGSTSSVLSRSPTSATVSRTGRRASRSASASEVRLLVALLAAWPLLVAGTAPMPVGGFVAGLNGLSRGLDGALEDARAAGFGAARIFLHWDKIETVEGVPDWTCRYLTASDLGPDADGDGAPDPWPGIPCDGTPCGCGYSADQRVSAASAGGVPVVLVLVGTPAWARGARAGECPADTPPRAFPLRHGKEDAFAVFAATAAHRYG